MATKVNVVLDSDNKKVRFEDVSVGGVFEYEGAYYMRIKPQFGVNSLKVYSPKSETDEATDSDVFTTVLFPLRAKLFHMILL